MPRRVLVRGFLDVSFQALFLNNCDFRSGGSYCWCPELSGGRPVPAFWQPGDHFGTSGAHWGTTGAADRIASWSMIFKDLRWISDRMLGVSEQILVFENQALWFGVYFSKSACAAFAV